MHEHESTNLIDDDSLWLAACLASESGRPDRLLDDPYAAHLAGSRGARVFAERPASRRAIAVAIAVAIVDELVHRVVVDHHLHTVLHLGAGLDTRPYRLRLPNDLRWVELDGDALVLYKGFRLAHVAPTCRVERVGVDLTDPGLRDGAIRRAAHGVARGLLVTEHALERFGTEGLQALEGRLPAGVKWWILGMPDATSGASDALIAAICDGHWQVADHRLLDDEARRLAPSRFAPPSGAQSSPSAGDFGGAWLLRRAV